MNKHVEDFLWHIPFYIVLGLVIWRWVIEIRGWFGLD